MPDAAVAITPSEVEASRDLSQDVWKHVTDILPTIEAQDLRPDVVSGLTFGRLFLALCKQLDVNPKSLLAFAQGTIDANLRNWSIH
jgi:hypothetical protein